ncbi:hypothetical protein DEU56DRAFT_870617 [Suillus clintonianus]|uniref:uncharacterized protein n=1 Tax=Suillus clintonianus TaxID=1904413 RepID=UPI001B8720FB|nr:uncharacterized protein DEU56DRAFT_870617 [Suillus clintonianus]KAG2143101.1 hypothetical protein DEU56DRAFT_870617 [Suillus clintonianus]
MVTQSFYAKKRVSGAKHIQPPTRQRAKVVLSKEARAALRLDRRAKSLRFKDSLDDAWKQLDDATKTIATTHHKSIRRVQNDLYVGRGLLRSKRSKPNLWNVFCWKKNQDRENEAHGKAALQSLVHDHKAEYLALSREEQDELLAEFTEWKDTKTTGIRTSTKSKINDITQTLKAVENELISLHCRTGAESILYTTRGSTDLPLRGIAFSTDGVENFMGTVMGIDNQDLVSKMEGFAVQGMQGSAKNHKKRVSDKRSEIREIINRKLQEATGDPSAKMQWTHYFRNVVQRYQVIVEGWPENIPFANLSQASSALADLEMLWRKWDTNKTYWKALTDEEFAEYRKERDDKLESGEIVDRRRRPRSDRGKKRNNTDTRKSTASREQHTSAGISDNSSMEEDEPATSSYESLTIPQPSDGASGSFTDSFDPPPFDYDAALSELDRLYGPVQLSSLL